MALISNGTTIASGGSLSVSTTPTTSQVGSAMAGISWNAVGSYAVGIHEASSLGNWIYIDAGDTIAGSKIQRSNTSGGQTDDTTLSGTWRAMGNGAQQQNTDSSNRVTVWLRIS